MDSYADIHKSYRGKVSDKWTSYFPIYDRLYRDIRQSAAKILEIGVQNGGSLEVLARYFPNAVKIFGCDINPACGSLRYDDPRIAVLVGDVNTQEVFSRVVRELAPIDLLLDDGSHKSIDIITAFVNYFPLVAPGGLYVIEDTVTLYAEAWAAAFSTPGRRNICSSCSPTW